MRNSHSQLHDKWRQSRSRRLFTALVLSLAACSGAERQPEKSQAVSLDGKFTEAQFNRAAKLNHLLKVELSVSFDGKRVDFNELIWCGSDLRRNLTSGVTSRSLPNRSEVTRPTADGGTVGFRVSWIVCNFLQGKWREGAPKDFKFGNRDNYLPQFFWYNASRAEEATYGEFYPSASYFKSPDARLKFIAPIRWSIPEHPASSYLLRQALRQEDDERKRGGIGFSGGYLTIASEDMWRSEERWDRAFLLHGEHSKRTKDTLINFLSSLPVGEKIIKIPKVINGRPSNIQIAYSLFRDGRFFRKSNSDYGLPQRELPLRGQLANLMANEYPGYADEIIPLFCDQVRGETIVRPIAGKKAFVAVYPNKNLCNEYGRSKWLEIDEIRVPFMGEHPPIYFDQRSRELYLLRK